MPKRLVKPSQVLLHDVGPGAKATPLALAEVLARQLERAVALKRLARTEADPKESLALEVLAQEDRTAAVTAISAALAEQRAYIDRQRKAGAVKRSAGSPTRLGVAACLRLLRARGLDRPTAKQILKVWRQAVSGNPPQERQVQRYLKDLLAAPSNVMT